METEILSLKDIITVCLHCSKELEFRGECDCHGTVESGKRTLSGTIKKNERGKITCNCGNIKFEPIQNEIRLESGEIVTLFRCSDCNNIVGKTERDK